MGKNSPDFRIRGAKPDTFTLMYLVYNTNLVKQKGAEAPISIQPGLNEEL